MDLKDKSIIVIGCGVGVSPVARRVAEERAKTGTSVIVASGVSCARIYDPYRFEKFEASIRVAPLVFDEPKSKYHK